MPFIETFDGLSTATLDGQHGWETALTEQAARVQVQNAVVFGGSQACSSTNATFLQRFSDSSGTDVWIDFYARPSRCTTAAQPTPGASTAAAFYVDGAGHVVARDNATWRTFSSYTVPLNTWTRFTVHVDYVQRVWALYVTGSTSNALATTLATDLVLATPTSAHLTQFRVASTNGIGASHRVAKTYLDEFTVAKNGDSGIPQVIDSDGDTLSDRWETDYLGGLNTSAGGSTDTDLDGWSDSQEQTSGTNPNDNSSYLQFIDIDLVSETSSDLAITVRGGGQPAATAYAGDTSGRRLTVLAAPAVTAPKTTVAVVPDLPTGLHTVTDPNVADLYSNHYYQVAASYAGASVTNTQEWAAYVRPRDAGSKYLISVPVNYGSDAENNLTGELGRHLARGLYAGLTTGDMVRYVNASGQYRTFTVIIDGPGVRWTENGETASFVVTPGMPLWVYRTASGTPLRNNAVFAGRSFLTSQAASFTFDSGSLGGWKAFGWPLATPRSVKSTDTGMSQLGFETVGTGGRVSTTNTASLGDEIWVWKDNTWKANYSLLSGYTEASGLNKRWWDNNRRRLADFSLEPGMAYYYRHRLNSFGGGTQVFNWTPQRPP